MSSTISGPGASVRRFLAGDPVTPQQLLCDQTPWEVAFDVDEDAYLRWDELIADFSAGDQP